VRYAINICNDANYPEAAPALADHGAAVICHPLDTMLSPGTAARWLGRSVENLRARARRTGCRIVSADVTGSQGALLSHGCTMILRIDGVIAARIAENVESAATYGVTDYLRATALDGRSDRRDGG
jgi:predicted amidohydrolase